MIPLFDLWKTQPAARQIRAAASRGTLPHALIFTGHNAVSMARFTAAAMECEHPQCRPCGVCRACRKVAQDVHPDVVTVRDADHKNLSVEVVRALRIDALIRPNEGRRKVYLFPDCALLTEQDQNVLLKLVEEGPAYAAFLFCGSAGILPTLRSRCVEWKLGNQEDARPDDAEALCRAIASCRRDELAALTVAWERSKRSREELAVLFSRSRDLFAAALLAACGCQTDGEELPRFLANHLTKKQIMSTIERLETYYAQCAFNVNTGHVLGALAAEWEDILAWK